VLELKSIEVMDTLLLYLLRVDMHKVNDSGKRVVCIILKYSRQFYSILWAAIFVLTSSRVCGQAVSIQPLLCTLVESGAIQWSCYCNTTILLLLLPNSLGDSPPLAPIQLVSLPFTDSENPYVWFDLVLGISSLLVHSDFEKVSFLLGCIYVVLNRRHCRLSLLALITFYIRLYIKMI
jgi:hypothetical protein